MPEAPPQYRLAIETDQGWIWLLKRNCSMAPRHLWMTFGFLCVVSLSVATFFWSMGALLVLPFAAMELVALGVAFLVYCRHATDHEIVRMEEERVVIERETAGRLVTQSLPRRWVRVSRGDKSSGLVSLRVSEREVQVGRYVRPALRDLLALELRHALHTAR